MQLLIVLSLWTGILVILTDTGKGDINGALTIKSDVQDAGNDKAGSVGSVQGVSDEVFYPTDDWQEVKPGQSIPRGLHVRLNLDTGKREAKLMEGDTGNKYWKKDDGRSGIVNTKEKYFSPETLKQALKNFKTEANDEKTRADEGEVKKKFRSYDELKKSLSDLNMDVKTDFEIVTELVHGLNTTYGKDEDNTVAQLTDLEYYLHQIDNAVLFCDLGGLQILAHLLNSSSVRIRGECALVLGSAMQSNPNVQIKAIEQGLMTQLLRSFVLSPDITLRQRSLYALSAMIRHFPYAQKRFIELGGLHALTDLFKEEGADKLQLKAVVLVNDLIIEQKLVLSNDATQNETNDKLRQYSQIPLIPTILEQQWCQKFSTLLKHTDHDSREKVIQLMTTLAENCKQDFTRTISLLKQIEKEYTNLALSEVEDNPSDTFFSDLSSRVSDLLEQLSGAGTSTSIRDEF